MDIAHQSPEILSPESQRLILENILGSNIEAKQLNELIKTSREKQFHAQIDRCKRYVQNLEIVSKKVKF